MTLKRMLEGLITRGPYQLAMKSIRLVTDPRIVDINLTKAGVCLFTDADTRLDFSPCFSLLFQGYLAFIDAHGQLLEVPSIDRATVDKIDPFRRWYHL